MKVLILQLATDTINIDTLRLLAVTDTFKFSSCMCSMLEGVGTN